MAMEVVTAPTDRKEDCHAILPRGWELVPTLFPVPTRAVTAHILGRIGDFRIQGRGGAPGPMRVVQHAPGQRDQIGVSLRDNFLGVLRSKYHPNSHHREGRLSADCCGEIDLMSLADRYFLVE